VAPTWVMLLEMTSVLVATAMRASAESTTSGPEIVCVCAAPLLLTMSAAG
jgi:hypothetical protein